MKKIKLSLIILIIAISSIMLLFPILFVPDESLFVDDKLFDSESKIYPLGNVDFNSGQTKAYIILSFGDMQDLPKRFHKHRVLFCDDLKVLNELKSQFAFNKTNGVTTFESKIAIYKNNKLVLFTGIYISDVLIELDTKSGTALAVKRSRIEDILLKFNPLYCPIIIFPNISNDKFKILILKNS